MGRTLLIGNPRLSWREWMRQERRERDLLCLDPSDPGQVVPGRLAMFRGEHPLATRFYGGLDPQRAPHVILAALAQLAPQMGPEGILQLFPYRPSLVLRQVVYLAAQAFAPDEILMAQGTEVEARGLPVHPAHVELEAALPVTVQHAQRKAQWLRLIEECEPHELELSALTIEGVRLGSGKALTAEQRAKAGLAAAAHVEKCGSSLLVVSDEETEDRIVSRAMDVTHSSRVHFVEPRAYEDLVCAFARPDGEEIGYGFIRSIDWTRGLIFADCTAVHPVQVPILRIGGLRVDREGRETGELKPWQV